MDAHRWQRLTEIFHGVIACRHDDREAFMAHACAGDDELREQVMRLVQAHDRAAQFLEGRARVDGSSDADGVTSTTVVRPAIDDRPDRQFAGTNRFAVRRRLGAGGMGVVYEALDRDRDEVVALKTLRHARPSDVYRLKREFRSLADVAHPNLVALYELFVDEESAFFTMELVSGLHFTQFVHGDGSRGSRDERARHALLQLVDGVAELHRRRKLHRDIKPSNILVTPAGRVVLLDFGLSSDILGDLAEREQMAGTPAYFAPERHSGAVPSPSQDWYAVGVTIYQALTGHLPFVGHLHDIRRMQREQDPPPPRDRSADVPNDLNAICVGLLHRDPECRFTDRQVRAALASESPRTGAVLIADDDSPRTLVGRQEQLGILADAWHTVKQGRAVTVFVQGPSGIGKSALIDAFFDMSKGESRVLLRGRCYEHESVPYKALDGVIDGLSQYLSALPRPETLLLIPSDTASLARLFPVMRRVQAVPGNPSPEHKDPVVVRQRGLSALRELLGRIASRRPVVMFIDDAHWADADSALLLGELLRTPDAPAMLTIVCARSEEMAAKPFLERLFTATASRVVISLETISPAHSRELITSMMRAGKAVPQPELDIIAREAGGNPFLLRQLMRHALMRPDWRSEGRSPQEILLEPIDSLPADAKPFLRMLAVCGRPMPPDLVRDAAGLDGGERRLVHWLRAGRLVRSSGSAERVEIYHDRLRELIVASIPSDEKSRLHGRMARAMMGRDIHEPEALFDHFREAGDHEAAAQQAAVAAGRAEAVLAFDRAAAYFRAALELWPGADAVPVWHQGLAAALANAGQPVAAGTAYLEAAQRADAVQRGELHRRAAEQFLLGGHIDRGLDTMRSVLQAVGLRVPSTPGRTLAALAWRRSLLRWRGMRYHERSADRVSPAALLRIDTCWSVASGLALVDHLRAAHFQTRALLLALEAGEPYRIARSLAAEVAFASVGGGRAERATAQLAKRAHTIALSAGNAHAIALTTLSTGVLAFMVGRWGEAARVCTEALDMLREQSGVIWEKALAQRMLIGSLIYEGRLREATDWIDRLLASARDSGNVYWDTELRTGHALLWLVRDDAEAAVQQADDAIARWSHEGFHRQHYGHVIAHIQSELYRGRADRAWQQITTQWSRVRRSLLLRIQWTRIEAMYWRARCALAMAALSTRRERQYFLAVARRDSHRIRRERMPWADPVACLLDATVSHLEHDDIAARRWLPDAIDGFDRAGMRLHAAAARRRYGELVDNARGREYRTCADEWMTGEGIRNPQRMTRLIAPGFATGREDSEAWDRP